MNILPVACLLKANIQNFKTFAAIKNRKRANSGGRY
jgi:hypothetical protein